DFRASEIVAGDISDERGNQVAAPPEAAVADEQRRYDGRKRAARSFLRSVTRRACLRLPCRDDLPLVASVGVREWCKRVPAFEEARQLTLPRSQRGLGNGGGRGKKAGELAFDDLGQPAPRGIVDRIDLDHSGLDAAFEERPRHLPEVDAEIFDARSIGNG